MPCEDNAFAYRHSAAFKAVIDTHAIKQRFIKPHCPWTNGKVERLNRTLATEWAYARPWTSNDDRRAGLTTAQPQRAGLVPNATNGVPPIVPPLLASAAALSIVIVSVLSMMRVLPWQRRLG